MKITTTLRRLSDPAVAAADAAIDPVEATRLPADPLALDPLSPVTTYPSPEPSPLADPLALDPLSPIGPRR